MDVPRHFCPKQFIIVAELEKRRQLTRKAILNGQFLYYLIWDNFHILTVLYCLLPT
jgi:hypothetical protein